MKSSISMLMTVLFSTAALMAAPSPASAQGEVGVRRFALVVGANNGGAERVVLRYADDDARAFAEVMAEMGAISAADTEILLDPDRAALQAGFDRLAQRSGELNVGQRREFFFYYSGHSDEVGLLLPDGRFNYSDVRDLVEAVEADVRIGVLDSCASGAFTRIKGGERVEPLLVDESSHTRGHAFITSTSADEAAQESDSLGASFFTHYLVSGMRGAADVSGDRRVTLSEAYRFAFDETLARTESTQAGPQHPAYEFQLAGTGDLVLTDLSETSATLALAEPLQGRFFIRDADGALVAELFKPAGRAMELGLSPGRYDIRVATDDELYAAEVELVEGATTVLDEGQLVAQAGDPTVSRGDVVVGAAGEEAEDVDYRHIPLAVSLVTPLDSNSVSDEPVVNNFAFNLIWGEAGRLDGVALGGFANRLHDRLRGVQLAGGLNLVGGDAYGVQFAGGANYAGGETEGLQWAGGVNIAEGDFAGFQAAGGLNVASDNMAGFQASGGVNVVDDLAIGAQMAPVNYAGEVEGTQVGAVNVAAGRVDGVQIGVINYADEADASIGLLGFTREGGVHPQIWTSDTAVTTLGFRTDANWTYTFLSAGIYPNGEDTSYLFGAGLGVKFPRFTPEVGLELDLAHHAIMYEDFDYQGGYAGLSIMRLMAVWQAIPELTVFAGPSLNVYVGEDANRLRERPGYIGTTTSQTNGDGDTTIEVWPGFALGITLL